MKVLPFRVRALPRLNQLAHQTPTLPAYKNRLLLTCTTVLLVAAALWLTQRTLRAAALFTGCGGEIVPAANADFEADVVELINLRRSEQGLPPLKFVLELTNAARYHATDLAQDDYFQHNTYDRVDGNLVMVCDWARRVTAYYATPRAENIAAGYTTPESVVQGWMDSPGHRANILSENREVGVGFDNNYWVQDFGTRDNVYPLIINREARQTTSPDVTLYSYGTWEQMRLRNDDGAWTEWQPFQTTRDWTLNAGQGLRTVEAEFRQGATIATSSDTIVLATGESAPAPTAAVLPPEPLPTPTGSSSGRASLTGRVTLEGRGNPPSNQWVIPLQVTLVDLTGKVANITLNVSTTPEGAFQIPDITPGAYAVMVRGAHTLQRVVNVTLQAGSNALDLGLLLEGDAMPDNTINVLDFSRMTRSYNECAANAEYMTQADFNNDNCINAQDVALLTHNFGRFGDANESLMAAAEKPAQSHLATITNRHAGQRFALWLSVNDGLASAVDAGALYLNFDQSRLKTLGVARNSAFEIELTNQIDNQLGHIDLAVGALTGAIKSPFTFTTITFEVLADIDHSDIVVETSALRHSDFAANGQSLVTGSSPNLQSVISAQEIQFDQTIFLPLVRR
ncbi:MAG: CAP domain-containing protein [Chloroflexi bacterium]|nr:CAP domain-containing protein [Chloroflexota bacterium]